MGDVLMFIIATASFFFFASKHKLINHNPNVLRKVSTTGLHVFLFILTCTVPNLVYGSKEEDDGHGHGKGEYGGTSHIADCLLLVGCGLHAAVIMFNNYEVRMVMLEILMPMQRSSKSKNKVHAFKDQQVQKSSCNVKYVR